MNIIKTRYYELLNSDPILLVHAIFDFIVIVAICKVGDRPLPGTVLPMPEITISPPLFRTFIPLEANKLVEYNHLSGKDHLRLTQPHRKIYHKDYQDI